MTVLKGLDIFSKTGFANDKPSGGRLRQLAKVGKPAQATGSAFRYRLKQYFLLKVRKY
ncbi:hypothetical protein [Nostoc sp. MG11]|uniref:hypothetical protein n=1 Tax=Nostoc sp. MG11 TaxID=2721166 RepID=UPI0018671FA6|nr:hypothetical protein [Nostoc sp. MG11]